MSSTTLRTSPLPVPQVPAHLPAACAPISSDAERVWRALEPALSSDPAIARHVARKLANVLAQKRGFDVTQGGLAQWQIEKIDTYIRRNLCETVMVKDLADQVSLSVSHFTRAFKTTFGEPPHARIMRIRIEHAQTLLRATDAPLSEIALACGLSDQAHLCRLFRRALGTTPNAWRRSLSWRTRAADPGSHQ